MNKVNEIDIEFIYKKRGPSHETNRLRLERNRILKPYKTRVMGKGRDNERLEEYHPSQQGRKEIEWINIMICNRCFHHCETLGTTPRREFNEIIHGSWINASLDTESQASQLKQEN